MNDKVGRLLRKFDKNDSVNIGVFGSRLNSSITFGSKRVAIPSQEVKKLVVSFGL